MKKTLLASTVLVFVLCGLARADGFIIPRPIPPDTQAPPDLSVKFHHVDVIIENQVARTTVDQVFLNHHHRDVEGTYIFPIAHSASISDFSMFVGGEELRGKILDRHEARRIYEEIVRRRQDPALLEYFTDGMFRASVYPIPARGETRIKLRYSEILEKDAGLCGYRYTLGTEKFSRNPIESVELRIRIDSKAPITGVYSPSHDIRVERRGKHEAVVIYREEGTRPDRDFLLYYTTSSHEVGLDLMAYEDDDGERYFLTLISPQFELEGREAANKDVIFVLDTSGSMQGQKIEQAKGALAFCLRNLRADDRFTVIDFDDQVRPFSPGLVRADGSSVMEALSFVEDCRAEGGTNINEALLEAIERLERGERAAFVIFLTDGLPTVGETNIARILENVERINRSRTRLFVFGVGYDVNTRLLDRLALDNHGASDYVHPSEDIEVKVSHFFTKVSHPILTDLSLEFDGVETFELYPDRLPDVFAGSQIVVLGRYQRDGRARAALSGRDGRGERTLEFNVDFRSRRENDFVPRLWATRKVGYLIDQLRLHGDNDELVAEIVRLSKKHGVVTEYTSFLVDVDYRIAARDLVTPARERLLEGNNEVVGKSAVNRAQAMSALKSAPMAVDSYKDEEGREHGLTTITQVGARTFYKKEGLWVEGAIDGEPETLKVKRYSQAYFDLLDAAPEVGKYYALGDRVIFRMGGRTVEISDEGKTELSAAEIRSLTVR